MSDKKNIDQFKSLHCCEKESARLIEQTKHGVLLPTKLWNRTTSESPLSISTLNGLSKSTEASKRQRDSGKICQSLSSDLSWQSLR